MLDPTPIHIMSGGASIDAFLRRAGPLWCSLSLDVYGEGICVVGDILVIPFIDLSVPDN